MGDNPIENVLGLLYGRRADDEKGQIESTVRENNEEGGSAQPNCAN